MKLIDKQILAEAKKNNAFKQSVNRLKYCKKQRNIMVYDEWGVANL